MVRGSVIHFWALALVLLGSQAWGAPACGDPRASRLVPESQNALAVCSKTAPGSDLIDRALKDVDPNTGLMKQMGWNTLGCAKGLYEGSPAKWLFEAATNDEAKVKVLTAVFVDAPTYLDSKAEEYKQKGKEWMYSFGRYLKRKGRQMIGLEVEEPAKRMSAEDVKKAVEFFDRKQAEFQGLYQGFLIQTQDHIRREWKEFGCLPPALQSQAACKMISEVFFALATPEAILKGGEGLLSATNRALSRAISRLRGGVLEMDAAVLTAEELVEFQTLAKQAKLPPAGLVELEAHYAALEKKLSNLNVVKIEALGGGKSESYLVTLSDGTQGVFKAASGYGDPKAEVAAFLVSKELRLKLVPVTVGRKVVINGVQQSGSVQFYVKEAQATKYNPTTIYDRDLNFFNVLIGKADRGNPGNYLIVPGKGTSAPTYLGIDHGQAFLPSRPWDLPDAKVRQMLPSRDFYLALKGVSDDRWREVLGSQIKMPGQVEGLIAWKNLFIERVEEMERAGKLPASAWPRVIR